MDTYFTSDTHFGHRKLAEFRGFDSTDEMNEALIERWNARVKPDDEVYHLGDFSFLGSKKTTAILERLHGRIYLVPGNHDKGMATNVRARFAKVLDPIHTVKLEYAELLTNPFCPVFETKLARIVLSHFPLLVWDRAHHGAWHLHGHSHGNLRFPNPSARIMDVGVDAVEYLSPVSFDEVCQHMVGSDYKPFDQHEES